jgi:hypothetical protein
MLMLEFPIGGGDPVEIRPAGPAPTPNNTGNPYFGKAPMTRTKFIAHLATTLGPDRYNRIREDAVSKWVFDVVMSATVIDVDDEGGDFLSIVGYLTSTNGADGLYLMTSDELNNLMAGWP